MERVFNITPKTKNYLLSKFVFTQRQSQLTAAKDVITNSRELVPEANLDELIDSITLSRHGSNEPYQGLSAITFSVGATIGSEASITGWHMHSPEVVFMSGYCLTNAAGGVIERLSTKFTELESGKRTLIQEASLPDKIQELEQKIASLTTVKGKLLEATFEYADRYYLHLMWPNEGYLEILRALPYLNSRAEDRTRRIICLAIKNQDRNRALVYLNRTKFKQGDLPNPTSSGLYLC